MFELHIEHCLKLEQDTGKWRLVKSVQFESEATSFVLGPGELANIIDTRMVVGPAKYDESSSKDIYDDGSYRLKAICSSVLVQRKWVKRGRSSS